MPLLKEACKVTGLVEIFTDGACLGNPGPGGWGAILRTGDVEKEISGSEENTTNNRMELMAAIVALETLNRPCKVSLVTDSKYLRSGILEWVPRWKDNGWKTSSRKPVKNVDLWRRLEKVVAKHSIEWRWVKGHSGHIENDRVDRIARRAVGGGSPVDR